MQEQGSGAEGEGKQPPEASAGQGQERPWPARVTPEGLASARAAAVEHARAATAARGGVVMGEAALSRGPRPVQTDVTEALPRALEALAERVSAALAVLERETATVGLPGFRTPREALLEVAATLRSLPETPLDYLTCLSGVDYPDRVEVVYHLFSIRGRVGLALRVGAAKAGRAPGGAVQPEQGDAELPWLPSVTGVWAGAEWHEREVYDLFGVRFEGHPDLRRILMPEGFSGGYPLRKDYVDRREQRARKVRDR